MQPVARVDRNAAQVQSAPAPPDDRGQRPRTQRVIIRHSVDPETIVFERQMDDFYLPIVTHSPWDPYSSTWALNAAYLARHPHDRHNLMRLYNFREQEERSYRLRGQHQQALELGLAAMAAGDFSRAAMSLSLAAEIDNGEPLCRVHLAQARLALGQYREAAAALDRAVDLQPKLAYLDLKLAEHYPTPDLLTQHADALRDHLAQHAEPPDVHFLLGFLRLQSGDYAEAAQWFAIVAGADPRNELAVELASLARARR